MAYLTLFREAPHLILFGLGLTAISSFGQTFFLSLSSELVMKDLALSPGFWGSMYSAATLCSACSLPWIGRYLDRIPLARFVVFAVVGLAVACLLFSQARGSALVFLALYLLRLTGQGLMGLTASTTMARAFDSRRGSALSVSSLGFSLGELVLPLLVPTLLLAVGWRASWAVFAFVLVAVALPSLLGLLHWARKRSDDAIFDPGTRGSVGASQESRWGLFRDLQFLAILPAYITCGFVATGLILYQSALAEDKGWSWNWMALSFSGFALARLVFSLAVGPMIDRFQARRIFPLSLGPLLLGILLMYCFDFRWVAPVYYSLMGVSLGMGGAASSAMWAERYGVARLGTIKSSTSMVAILGTAVSPVLMGWSLDTGVPFDAILMAIALWIVFSTVAALWALSGRRASSA